MLIFEKDHNFFFFLKDLNKRPKELISGAMNSLFETSSSATNPLFDTVLGITNPPSNTNSLVSEENFWSSACDSDKQR